MSREIIPTLISRNCYIAQSVKNLPAMQETQVQSLAWKDPLENDMATHSSVLAGESLMDRGAWRAIVHGVTRVGHGLSTEPPPPPRAEEQVFIWWTLIEEIILNVIRHYFAISFYFSSNTQKEILPLI